MYWFHTVTAPSGVTPFMLALTRSRPYSTDALFTLVLKVCGSLALRKRTSDGNKRHQFGPNTPLHPNGFFNAALKLHGTPDSWEHVTRVWCSAKLAILNKVDAKAGISINHCKNQLACGWMRCVGLPARIRLLCQVTLFDEELDDVRKRC